jgi:MscS family membrane protein
VRGLVRILPSLSPLHACGPPIRFRTLGRMTSKWKFLGLSAVLWLLLFVTLPHWLGAQTNTNTVAVTNAPARPAPATNLLTQLAAERRDLLTFGLDRFEPLRTPFLGNPLWQYFASLIYILLAFYAAKFLDWLTRVWLRQFTSQTKTPLDDQLLELLNGPVKVLAFVVFLHIGLNIFHWPAPVEVWLHKLFILVLAGSLTYSALKITDVVVDFWRLRGADGEKTLNDQLFIVIRKGLKAFLLVVAVLVTMQNLGVNVTAALASLSIGGLAIGLAAQDTLNLFGAVAIFADKPFRVGDRIRLDAVDGTVEGIGLRSTRVRNLDGHLVTIPNKTMGNATITNVTARPNIKTEMNLGLTYDTPPEKVQRASALLLEIYRAHAMTSDVWVGFNRFDASALNLYVVHWWGGTNFKDYLAGMQELNLEIKRRFAAEGIEFAYPTQTVHVRTK